MYGITARWFLPWETNTVSTTNRSEAPFSIDLKYERTDLKVNDKVSCQVTVKAKPEQTLNMVMLDLGIPPGFEIDPAEFDALVKTNLVEKYQVSESYLTLYLRTLESGKPLSFTYGLKARLPAQVRTPESVVWLYYNPATRAIAPPVELEVNR